MTQRFERASVSAARLISPGCRNVTIAAASLAGVAFAPGADVVIRLPQRDGGVDERRYSVWKSGAPSGTLDVCVVQHGLGPGSRWAGRCTPGDMVEIARSQVIPISPDTAADVHVCLGDETSIASAEALIRSVPAQKSVFAYLEVATREHRWPDSELVRPDQVQWVERVGRPGAALLTRLADEGLRATPGTTVYVTGEAWLCAMVHAHVVRERGFSAGAVRAMPYWKARPRPA